jgi:hypothetical protein
MTDEQVKEFRIGLVVFVSNPDLKDKIPDELFGLKVRVECAGLSSIGYFKQISHSIRGTNNSRKSGRS